MHARTAALDLARPRTWLVLAVGICLCTGTALAQRAPATTAPRIDPAQAARDLGYAGPANFSHRTHRALDCTSCHNSAERHGGLTVKTLTDCQRCHHAPERQASCGSCHTTSEIRPARSVPIVMQLSVWREGKQRALPFEHGRHASLACATCHTTPVTLAVARTCQSCHDNHHTADRTCRTCHVSPKTAHTRVAHLGCAGSGCHTLTGTISLQPVRNVCLTCHRDKVNHMPGQECAKCHQVQWQPNAVNPTRTGTG